MIQKYELSSYLLNHEWVEGGSTNPNHPPTHPPPTRAFWKFLEYPLAEKFKKGCDIKDKIDKICHSAYET